MTTVRGPRGAQVVGGGVAQGGGEGHAPIGVVVAGRGRGGGVRRDVGRVRGGGVAGAPGREQVMRTVLGGRVGGVVATVHHLPHLLLLLGTNQRSVFSLLTNQRPVFTSSLTL